MSKQEKIERASRRWYQVKQARHTNEIAGADEVVEQLNEPYGTAARHRNRLVVYFEGSSARVGWSIRFCKIAPVVTQAKAPSAKQVPILGARNRSKSW
jgi:hypothetical protein